ncbi:TetR/AcrR family transcriptional regulator [Thalassotalea maritima]|uniref:TetR/AcrR family transcriptional regulator n=1 Tax=Thalassotalea maritima TaxID=3242416 RepID=UPI003527F72B
MAKSKQQIIDAATACFLQHGYQATNISMISRYAEISRVTIHKHFGSKDVLLRAVIEHHCQRQNALFAQLKQQNQDIWATIATALKAIAEPMFNDIKQDMIRNELLYAGRKYAQDIIDQHRQNHVSYIQSLLEDAIDTKKIRLDTLNVSSFELAEMIEINFKGLIHTNRRLSIEQRIDQLISVYRQATRIENNS